MDMHLSNTKTLHDKAFEKELASLGPSLLRFALKLCNGHTANAEDLAQNARLKAWMRREDYTIGSNLKAWVFTIMYHQFISSSRANWRTTTLGSEAIEAHMGQYDGEQLPHMIGRHLIERIIPNLPNAYWQAIEGVCVLERRYEEAAAEMGIKTGTLKSRVSRGRAMARMLLDGEESPVATPTESGRTLTTKTDSCLFQKFAETPLVEQLVDKLCFIMRQEYALSAKTTAPECKASPTRSVSIPERELDSLDAQ